MREHDHIWALCEIETRHGHRKIVVLGAPLFGGHGRLEAYAFHVIRAKSYRLLAEKHVRMQIGLSLRTGPVEDITDDDGTKRREIVEKYLEQGYKLIISKDLL